MRSLDIVVRLCSSDWPYHEFYLHFFHIIFTFHTFPCIYYFFFSCNLFIIKFIFVVVVHAEVRVMIVIAQI